MPENDKEYYCKHFSLSLAEGKNRSDIVALLEAVANELRNMNFTNILDVTFSSDTDDNAEEVMTITVYYN